MDRIAIIDYGMGNIRSVSNAFEQIDHPADLVADPQRVREFDRVVLPGVGAFGEAIENLRSSGMAPALDEHVKAGKPLLGICLGMQLICRSSTEDGEHAGLGWIDAAVTGFPAGEGVKIPHMGWNSLHLEAAHLVLNGLESGCDVYFLHGYRVGCEDGRSVLATTEHGSRFASVIGAGPVVGMQFHPEKSQRVGLKLLENFVAWNA